MKSLINAIFIALTLLNSSLSLNAQSALEIETRFDDFSLSTDTLNIKARLFTPDLYDDSISYPLVVTLHGIGECGTDNRLQVLYNHVATTWGKDDFQSVNPCFIFSPQCPVNYNWNIPDVYKSVMILLDSLVKNYSIDTNRIYLTGLSLGGNGTWSYLLEDPDLYAAAIPVCSWMDSPDLTLSSIQSIEHIPVWIFHGNQDPVVPVSSPRDIIDLYAQLNMYPVLTHNFYRLSFNLDGPTINHFIDDHADFLYSEVPDVYHDVWNTAYQMPLLRKWLFMQKRHEHDNIIVEKTGLCRETAGNADFSFSASEKVVTVGIWLEHFESPNMYFVDTIQASDSIYHFDSEAFEDFPYCRLKFLGFDAEGFVIGKDYSDTLWINNPGNSAPYVALVNDRFVIWPATPYAYTVEAKLADPESDPLDVKFLVSYDKGLSFDVLEEFTGVTARHIELPVNFRSLPLSTETVIRIEVTDGEYTSSIQTLDFKNKYGYIDAVPVTIPDGFHIYPNPADDYLDLEMDIKDKSAYSIQVLSMDGRTRLTCKQSDMIPGKHVVRIVTSQLEPGQYLVHIENSRKKIYTRMIIIQ